MWRTAPGVTDKTGVVRPEQPRPTPRLHPSLLPETGRSADVLRIHLRHTVYPLTHDSRYSSGAYLGQVHPFGLQTGEQGDSSITDHPDAAILGAVTHTE